MLGPVSRTASACASVTIPRIDNVCVLWTGWKTREPCARYFRSNTVRCNDCESFCRNPCRLGWLKCRRRKIEQVTNYFRDEIEGTRFNRVLFRMYSIFRCTFRGSLRSRRILEYVNSVINESEVQSGFAIFNIWTPVCFYINYRRVRAYLNSYKRQMHYSVEVNQAMWCNDRWNRYFNSFLITAIGQINFAY